MEELIGSLDEPQRSRDPQFVPGEIIFSRGCQFGQEDGEIERQNPFSHF
jgi:hypothetical protein